MKYMSYFSIYIYILLSHLYNVRCVMLQGQRDLTSGRVHWEPLVTTPVTMARSTVVLVLAACTVALWEGLYPPAPALLDTTVVSTPSQPHPIRRLMPTSAHKVALLNF